MIVDTGFTEYLTLPQSLIALLALAWVHTEGLTLADGSIMQVDLYECVVEWDGRPRRVAVHCMEGSPLLGMSLLYDHLLTMAVVGGGQATSDAVP